VHVPLSGNSESVYSRTVAFFQGLPPTSRPLFISQLRCKLRDCVFGPTGEHKFSHTCGHLRRCECSMADKRRGSELQAVVKHVIRYRSCHRVSHVIRCRSCPAAWEGGGATWRPGGRAACGGGSGHCRFCARCRPWGRPPSFDWATDSGGVTVP
jgi:hypothetical protein